MQNRIIKFRIFSKEKKCMYYPSWSFLAIFFEFEREDKEDLVCMQFTGLLDRNDKEIYQDDILNIDGLNVKVEWYNGSWTVEYFKNPRRSYLSTFDETDVEVVGNVYEHPELLHNKK